MRVDRVAGAGENDEEGIALRIHLVAVPLREGGSQNCTLIGEDRGVGVAGGLLKPDPKNLEPLWAMVPD